MTYTINQAVDVNAAVDIGNINLEDNTISSTNTNGDILLSPNGTGNVGVGTASPDSELHINGNISLDSFGQGDGAGIFFRDGYNADNDPYNLSITAKDWRGGTTTSDGFVISGYYGIGFQTGSNSYSSGNIRMFVANNGLVGIGTTTPYARLHVNGTGTSTANLQTGNRRYFGYDTGFVTDTSAGGDPANTISIYGTDRIVTGTYIVSHSNTTFSDRRIKDNIVDVEDDICLQKLRLIKPKQYTYKDTVSKGTEPVWGFIAQEVAETLDYAVSTMQKAIPNVYKLASVSEDGLVLTFDESVTLETMDTNKLQLKTLVSEEHDVTVLEVLSSTSIRLTEPLTQEHHTGTFGDESIVRQVFVYGQWVDDFHVLKKDAIFTVAVSALQEVDRRQSTDNERILELEGDLTEAQETIATQSQDIATLQAQVAALMQHTGVTL